MKEQGLKASDSDPSVFHMAKVMPTPDGPREEILVAGCYVDDLFLLLSKIPLHPVPTLPNKPPASPTAM